MEIHVAANLYGLSVVTLYQYVITGIVQGQVWKRGKIISGQIDEDSLKEYLKNKKPRDTVAYLRATRAYDERWAMRKRIQSENRI